MYPLRPWPGGFSGTAFGFAKADPKSALYLPTEVGGFTARSIKDEDEYSVAPEVCIEVLSSSNTEDEIGEKKALYFERGAKEVWLCNRSGDIDYFDPGGKLAKSAFFPNFPQKLDPDV